LWPEGLWCAACGRVYAIVSDIPVMLVRRGPAGRRPGSLTGGGPAPRFPRLSPAARLRARGLRLPPPWSDVRPSGSASRTSDSALSPARRSPSGGGRRAVPGRTPSLRSGRRRGSSGPSRRSSLDARLDRLFDGRLPVGRRGEGAADVPYRPGRGRSPRRRGRRPAPRESLAADGPLSRPPGPRRVPVERRGLDARLRPGSRST